MLKAISITPMYEENDNLGHKDLRELISKFENYQYDPKEGFVDEDGSLIYNFDIASKNEIVDYVQNHKNKEFALVYENTISDDGEILSEDQLYPQSFVESSLDQSQQNQFENQNQFDSTVQQTNQQLSSDDLFNGTSVDFNHMPFNGNQQFESNFEAINVDDIIDELIPSKEDILNELNPHIEINRDDLTLQTIPLINQSKNTLITIYSNMSDSISKAQSVDISKDLDSFRKYIKENPPKEVTQLKDALNKKQSLNEKTNEELENIRSAWQLGYEQWLEDIKPTLYQTYLSENPDTTEQNVAQFLDSMKVQFDMLDEDIVDAKEKIASSLLLTLATHNKNPDLANALRFITFKNQISDSLASDIAAIKQSAQESINNIQFVPQQYINQQQYQQPIAQHQQYVPEQVQENQVINEDYEQEVLNQQSQNYQPAELIDEEDDIPKVDNDDIDISDIVSDENENVVNSDPEEINNEENIINTNPEEVVNNSTPSEESSELESDQKSKLNDNIKSESESESEIIYSSEDSKKSQDNEDEKLDEEVNELLSSNEDIQKAMAEMQDLENEVEENNNFETNKKIHDFDEDEEFIDEDEEFDEELEEAHKKQKITTLEDEALARKNKVNTANDDILLSAESKTEDEKVVKKPKKSLIYALLGLLALLLLTGVYFGYTLLMGDNETEQTQQEQPKIKTNAVKLGEIVNVEGTTPDGQPVQVPVKIIKLLSDGSAEGYNMNLDEKEQPKKENIIKLPKEVLDAHAEKNNLKPAEKVEDSGQPTKEQSVENPSSESSATQSKDKK